MTLLLADFKHFEENVKIKFDSKLHSIDINTLIETLEQHKNILLDIHNYLNPQSKITIDVKAFVKNGFDIDLLVILAFLQSNMELFKNIKTLKDYFSILKDLLKLSLHLDGEKPTVIKKMDNSVNIENNDGKIINVIKPVFNIYTDTNVKQHIADNFKAIDKDKKINNYKLIEDTKPLINLSKRKIKKLSSICDKSSEDKNEKGETVTISIIRPSFDDKYKWEFFYRNAIRISAKINDQDFLRRVDDGESFSKGDRLEVKLKINLSYNDKLKAYENKSYEIEKVIRHIPRHIQEEIK